MRKPRKKGPRTFKAATGEHSRHLRRNPHQETQPFALANDSTVSPTGFPGVGGRETIALPPLAGAGAWLATTFHLRNGTDQLLDPEGIDLPNLGAVRTQALRSARDTLSNELRDDRLDLRYWIDVEDTDGRAVFSLLLGNAFETIRA